MSSFGQTRDFMFLDIEKYPSNIFTSSFVFVQQFAQSLTYYFIIICVHIFTHCMKLKAPRKYDIVTDLYP